MTTAFERAKEWRRRLEAEKEAGQTEPTVLSHSMLNASATHIPAHAHHPPTPASGTWAGVSAFHLAHNTPAATSSLDAPSPLPSSRRRRRPPPGAAAHPRTHPPPNPDAASFASGNVSALVDDDGADPSRLAADHRRRREAAVVPLPASPPAAAVDPVLPDADKALVARHEQLYGSASVAGPSAPPSAPASASAIPRRRRRPPGAPASPAPLAAPGSPQPLARNPDQTTRFDPARRSPTAKRAVQDARGPGSAAAAAAAAAMLTDDRLRDLALQRGGFAATRAHLGVDAGDENDFTIRPAFSYNAPMPDDPALAAARPAVLGSMRAIAKANDDAALHGAAAPDDIEAGLAADGLYVGKQPELGAKNAAAMRARLGLEDDAALADAGTVSATRWLTNGALVADPNPVKERIERPTHFPSESDALFQVVLTKPVSTASGVVLDSRPSFYTLNVAVDDVVFLDHPLFREEEVLAHALDLMYAKYTALAARNLVAHWSLRLEALTDALAAAASPDAPADDAKGLALDDSLNSSMVARRSFRSQDFKELATTGASAGRGRHAKRGPVSLTRSQSYVLQVDQAELEALHAAEHASHLRKLRHDIAEARRNRDLVEFDLRALVYDMIDAWSLLKTLRASAGFVSTPHTLVFRTLPADAAADTAARAADIDARVADAHAAALAAHEDAHAAHAAALAAATAAHASAARPDDTGADSGDAVSGDSDDAGPSSPAAQPGAPAPTAASLGLDPPPAFEFDEAGVRADIAAHLEATKRAPGEPELVPILTHDAPLSPAGELPASEVSRRTDVAKIACFVRLVANESNVTKSKTAAASWPSMRLAINEGFGLQLFSWPSLKLQLVSSGLFKSPIAEATLVIPGEAGALQTGDNADFATYYLVADTPMRAAPAAHSPAATALLQKYLPPSAKYGSAARPSLDGRHTIARVRVRLAWAPSPHSSGLAAAPRRPPAASRTLLPTSLDALTAWARDHDMDPDERQNAQVLAALAAGSSALATPANVERLKLWVQTVDLDPNDPRNAPVLHLLAGLGDAFAPDPRAASPAHALAGLLAPRRRPARAAGPPFRTTSAAGKLIFPAAHLPADKRLELLALRWSRPIAYSGPVPLDASAVREAWFGEASDAHDAVVIRDQYVAKVREMTALTAQRRGYDSGAVTDFADVVAERPPPTFSLAFAGILKWFQPRRRFRPVRETRVAKTVAVHRAELVIKVVRGYSIPNREAPEPELVPGAAQAPAPGAHLALPGDDRPAAGAEVEPVVQIRFQDGIEWTHRSAGPNPVWNDTITFEIEPPDGSFRPEVLATMQDLVYFNIFDSKVAPFQSFMDEEELRYKIPRHNVWLGTFGLPFSTIYSNSLIQGRFHVNVPLVSPGYEREMAPASIAVEHISPYAPTMLELYITTRPALEPPRAVAEKASSRETPEFLAYARKWEKSVRSLSTFGDRALEVLVANQSRASVFVTRYIRPLAPPPDLTTARQILRYVSLLPFLSDSAAFAGRRHVWNNMEEFFEYGVGDEEEHALLLASYFLYSDLRAYVVLGRGIPEGDTAYVMTIGDAGQVHFWNAHAGKVFSAHDPDIPLRSIGAVFNADNLWANIQPDDAPWVISYNVHNTAAWKPFFTRAFAPTLESVQPASIPYPPVSADAVDDISRLVRKAVKAKLEEWRLEAGLPIRFNSQATLALSDLLVRFERHYQGLEVLSPDSHRIELARLLTTYNISGFPLQMTYTHVDPIIEAVRNTGVHLDRHPRGQLALAVRVFAYSNVYAVWCYTASLTPKEL